MATLLRMKEYGFDVSVRTNETASLRELKLGLTRLFSDEPEIALFFFAGHGVVTDMGGYLVTHDYPEQIEGEPGLNLGYLKDIVQAKAKPKTATVVILDCCHSGYATLRAFDEPALQWRHLSQTTVDQSLRFARGRVLLAACRPEERSVELAKEGHGIFTFHLLDGMLGPAADRDGYITPTSLWEHLARVFTTIKIQKPVFRGDLDQPVILAMGFTPRSNTRLDDAQAETLENQAQQRLDEYVHMTAMSGEDWAEFGFKLASTELSHLIQWQQEKVAKFPALIQRPKFKHFSEESVPKEQIRLGTLVSGIQTHRGGIVERLGKGGFGTVWKIQSPNGDRVAYKVYNVEDLTLPDKLRRFRQGHLAMGRLAGHMNIVKVMEFTECPFGFYMEYIDGPNLSQRKEEDPAEAVFQLLQIADALRYAHQKGVVHRDVKPANILLRYEATTDKWVPFLTDFDLAWFLSSSTFSKRSDMAYATLIYGAPEQLAQPSSEIAHRKTTDVYAFGQLAYFALRGSNPFGYGFGDNVEPLRETLNSWPSVVASQQLIKLYEKCTKSKPEDRIQSFDEVWEILHDIFQSLQQFNPGNRLSQAQFLDQVRFGIIGLQDAKQADVSSFLSKTERTRIELYPKPSGANHIDLDVDLEVHTELMLAGLSHEEARGAISARIDRVLQGFPGCKRVPGQQGHYSTTIQIRKLSLDLAGAVQASQIVTRVVEAIERVSLCVYDGLDTARL